MAYRWDDIDTSSIDAYVEVRRHRERFEELLERAESNRDKVDTVVYERVSGDYRGRLQALEAQAAEARQSARMSFVKLRQRREEAHGKREDCRLALEELSFRTEIGEVDEADANPEMKKLQKEHDEHDAGAQQADEMYARYDILEDEFGKSSLTRAEDDENGEADGKSAPKAAAPSAKPKKKKASSRKKTPRSKPTDITAEGDGVGSSGIEKKQPPAEDDAAAVDTVEAAPRAESETIESAPDSVETLDAGAGEEATVMLAPPDEPAGGDATMVLDDDAPDGGDATMVLDPDSGGDATMVLDDDDGGDATMVLDPDGGDATMVLDADGGGDATMVLDGAGSGEDATMVLDPDAGGDDAGPTADATVALGSMDQEVTADVADEGTGTVEVPDDAPVPPPASSGDATMMMSAAELAGAAAGEGTAVMGQSAPTERTMIVPMARLVEQDSGTEHMLGTEVHIGRDKSNQIRLTMTGVSRNHAMVTFDGDTFKIEDRGSTYGTFVNDEKIDSKPLEDGDRVRIGGVNLVFHK